MPSGFVTAATDDVAMTDPALAAIGGGIVTGGVAILGVLLQGRSAERAQRERLTHDIQLAREGREQDRMSTAYEDLLVTLGRFTALIQRAAYPGTNGEDFPQFDEDEQERLQARVNAYGSDAVRDLLADYFVKTNRFFLVQRDLGILVNRVSGRGEGWRDQFNGYASEFTALKGEIAEREQRIIKQVNTELHPR